MAESRELDRQRLKERLQKLADEHGEVFPLQATAAARSSSSLITDKLPTRVNGVVRCGRRGSWVRIRN
jgi:hypothetical protein